MREITIKIPDKKFDFFMELIDQLGVEVTDTFEIPEEHKAIVRERINNSKQEDMVPWNDARKRLTFKDQP
jgi:hypothetical protein